MKLTIDDVKEINEHMEKCKFKDKLGAILLKDIENYEKAKHENPDSCDPKKVGITTNSLLEIIFNELP